MRALAAACVLALTSDFSQAQGIDFKPAAAASAALTSPVTTDPLSFTGAVTFDNAANTPLACSDGLQDSTLTAGRVTFAGASGRLSDDADMTFATDTLTATKLTVSTTLTSPNLVSAAGVTQAISATAPAVPTNGATAGAAVTITASPAIPNAGAGTDGAAAGGSVTITSGAAARDTSGNAKGGDINLVTGAGIGTGTAGQVVFPVGSAAAPSVTFTGDVNTGFYWPSSDGISISLGGTERVRMTTGFSPTGVRLGVPICFGTVGTPTACLDTAGTGGIKLTDASTGVGWLNFALSVETVAATKTPAVTESAELYTNGADVDGQAITLTNDPTVGTCFEFALTSTDTSNSFAIAPSAGETLQDGASACATSFSATAKGATARICAVSGGSGGLWLVMSKNGTWTCS